jgi:ABC-type multidrug transport system fused ATPase/permease subunit
MISQTSQNCDEGSSRALSNATKNAIAYCEKNAKVPVKVTFRKLMFEVEHKFSEEERVYRKDAGFPDVPSVRKQLLKECSGYAMPGQTLYIMGASGAGKTTLLNAISDRIGVGKG